MDLSLRNSDSENQSDGILNSPRFRAIPTGPVLEELHIAAPHKAAAALHFLADVMNRVMVMLFGGQYDDCDW